MEQVKQVEKQRVRQRRRAMTGVPRRVKTASTARGGSGTTLDRFDGNMARLTALAIQTDTFPKVLKAATLLCVALSATQFGAAVAGYLRLRGFLW